jgi:two-component system, OmpR family, response regulator
MVTLANQLREIIRRLTQVADALSKEDRQLDTLGQWAIDWGNACAFHGSRKVVFTRSEALILKILCDNRGVIVSRADLTTALFGGSGVESRTVDQHVSNLRRKLGDALIASAHSRGYRVS